MGKPTNPKSPWRKHNGGFGPLSQEKIIREAMDPDANMNSNMAGVLDSEFFQTPDRLTKKQLEELL